MARRLYLEIPADDELKELIESAILEDGREAPNPTKRFVTVDQRPPTLKEQVERIMANRIIREAIRKQGYETFQESQDFEVDEDINEFGEGYTVSEMVPEVPIEKSESEENQIEPEPTIEESGEGS